MTKLKLVSDFDGIWTNQNIEAEYVWNYILNSVSELSGNSLEATKKFFEQCKSEMNKSPEKYGWTVAGEIAVFYKEDPYGDNNAIFGFIDNTDLELLTDDFINEVKKMRSSILSKYKTLADFSQECFTLSTGRFKSEGSLNPIKSTPDVVKKINSLDTDIVVVSNSTTDKIKYLFSKADIKVSGDLLGQRERVHARGDAKKFMIYNSETGLPKYLSISDKINVPLRRSSYYNILIEEKTDYVIGDVFSLDIALPLYLRMNDKSFANLKVIQRVQPYTPGWVKDYLSREEFKGIAFMVNSVDEVPEVISQNRN